MTRSVTRIHRALGPWTGRGSVQAVAFVGAVVAFSACTSLPDRVPARAAASLPDRFDEGPAARGPDVTVPSVRWWDTFADPALGTLVDSVLARNLDLRSAALRVAEVQALYRITASASLPTVQASVDGTRQNIPTNAGATGRISDRIPGFPDRFDFTTYSASLGLSYELDLWGRVRNATQAALHEWAATVVDLEGVRTGVVSEAVATYLELADARQQLEAARETTDLLRERAGLSADRYQRGLVSSFEMYRIQQALEESRASVPLLESALFDARSRLSTLAGGYPSEWNALLEGARLPGAVDAPVPAGLPSRLLEARPDVRAAEERMEAARRRVGVARADRFPRFSLTAAGGTQSSDLAELVDTGQRFGLVSGAVLQPLFGAGALKAAERAAYVRYEQAVAAYDRSVLTAFREASATLVSLEAQRRRIEMLAASVDEAHASEAAQERRYGRGIGDYVALLDARINRIRAESAHASGLRALALARLTLHRALGGAWIEPAGP